MGRSASLVDIRDVLAEAQRIGIIGETDLDAEVEHGVLFAAAARDTVGTIVDLGSGGGLPGLVIAAELPDRRVVLTDRRQKRTDFLRRAVRRLGVDGRVLVIEGEVPASLRAFIATGVAVDDGGEPGATREPLVVTARSFGPINVTAAVAARITAPGDVLVVSLPPDAQWDEPPSELWRPGGVLGALGPIGTERRAPAPVGRVARFVRLAALSGGGPSGGR